MSTGEPAGRCECQRGRRSVSSCDHTCPKPPENAHAPLSAKVPAPASTRRPASVATLLGGGGGGGTGEGEYHELRRYLEIDISIVQTKLLFESRARFPRSTLLQTVASPCSLRKVSEHGYVLASCPSFSFIPCFTSAGGCVRQSQKGCAQRQATVRLPADRPEMKDCEPAVSIAPCCGSVLPHRCREADMLLFFNLAT